jgi:hypothetical protein
VVKEFKKGIGAYRCRRCGKLTRETGGNESAYNLCLKCLHETEDEEK